MTWLIRTDTAFSDVGKVPIFTMEMAFGDEENDFELTVPYSTELAKNTLVYVPETEWGGLIREDAVIREDGLTFRRYKGPTWHGLLSQRVVRPDPGESHLRLTGAAGNIIQSLIERCRLADIFVSGECGGAVIDVTLDRYCTLYEALRKALLAAGCVLTIQRDPDGLTRLGATSRPVLIDDAAGSRFGFRLERLHPVNHLVCLGKGEMVDRPVIDVYADSNGDVSQTQSIFGVDEIEEPYDDSTAEQEALLEDGLKHLKELQEFAHVEIILPAGDDYIIDSVVGIADAKTGLEATASICKAVVEFDDVKPPEVTYTLTDAVLNNASDAMERE